MRIAFVTFEYPPSKIGGAGVYARELTKGLAGLGIDVTVFTPTTSEPTTMNAEVPEVKVIRTRPTNGLPFSAPWFWLQLPAALKRANNTARFDIVHFNGLSYGFLKKRLTDVPQVTTILHPIKEAINSQPQSLLSLMRSLRSETNFLMKFIEKRCISSSDRIIAISDFTKDHIQQEYGVREERIARIYLGVDARGCEDSGFKTDRMRRSLGLEKMKIVLFVGRIDDPRKGLDVLLRAFGMITRRTDLRLLVVGNGQVEDAEKMASELGIRNRTIFAGSLPEDELDTCYAMCDLVVCPSRLEGFGLVILEAMAAGKPVVATRVGSIPEILKDDVNGLLVPDGDYALMSEAMLAILSNPELTRIYSKNNKENARSYDWSSTAKKTIEVYDQLVNRQSIT